MLGHSLQRNVQFRDFPVEQVLCGKPRSQFRIDYIIDEQRSLTGPLLKLVDRPSPPIRVIGENIEQDVGVDQRHFLVRVIEISPLLASMNSSVVMSRMMRSFARA